MSSQQPPSDQYVWQDREIRFDLPINLLRCRKGEFEIDSIHSIEDTKGNNGERGSLVITNLRMIWTSMRNPKLNLSIGYNCILNITTHTANSRLRGHTQALFVLTKFSGSRFEFIFTNLVKNSPRLFTTVQAVYTAYESSKLYRDLKLRAAIIRDKELLLLPKEQVYSTIKGVWNLSSDQGNLGTFVITNVRLVWFADMAENFNVSIPYLQMASVKIRNSKFGAAFVLETTPQSGKYVLGFQMKPQERLHRVHNEVSSLHKLFSNNPIFGVEYDVEEKPQSLEQLTINAPKDDVEIVGKEDTTDPLVAYYADGGSKNVDRKVVYNNDLGLAVEELREGYSIRELWKCLHKT
mmetsp:Transcript_11594/g.17145  ORF Transcript_11594/g.17145 Transcript_11594/m.17145 type:complete len:351 (-) Transcript_11594:1409-2461(-)